MNVAGYAWAPGAAFNGDPNEVQAELERIKRLPGGITPDAVIACARPSGSVLHPLIFNVDTGEAAERYYHGRATSLLNAIRIVNEQGEVTRLRPNIRVRVGEDHTYRGLDDEAAREQRASWLRGRLVAIRGELNELGLYPQIALAIDETFSVEAVA